MARTGAFAAVVPWSETYAAIAAGFAWGGFGEAGEECAEEALGAPFVVEGRVGHC